MTEEMWKDIPGYEGVYQVSDAGRIRSWKSPNGRGVAKEPRLLKPVPFQGKKYLRVALTSSTGGVKHKRVHRLVLEAFVSPCPEGMECRHKDGDATNNCLLNLQWGTHEENIEDQATHGTRMFGEAHPNSILTTEQVSTIKKVIGEVRVGGKRDMTGKVKALAKLFEVSIGCIYSVAQGKVRLIA